MRRGGGDRPAPRPVLGPWHARRTFLDPWHPSPPSIHTGTPRVPRAHPLPSMRQGSPPRTAPPFDIARFRTSARSTRATVTEEGSCNS